MSLSLSHRDPTSQASRVDLHLHSRASTDTGSWFLSRTLMPESFVDPEQAYTTCKKRGMHLVTLTDHNTIAGALEIAHHPDVIVGVEITTYFPEDQVPLHVLAWGVDENVWSDLDRARANVLELVACLGARRIPHALAHPLHRVGDTLTVEHIEQCLLLFGMWEGLNGARPKDCNDVAVRIAQAASPQLLERLADKYGLAARTNGPPALTGGSDDHSLLEAAGAWTETPVAQTPADLLDHLRAGRTVPRGAPGSATSLAHSVGTLPLKRYAMSGAGGLPPQLRKLFGDVIHHPVAGLDAARRAALGTDATADSIGLEVLARIRSDRTVVREFRRLGRRPDSPTRSRERLRLVTGWLHKEALASALDSDGLSLGSIGRRADALAGAAAVAAPYFLASRYMRGESAHAREFERSFFGAAALGRDTPTPHAIVVTDTFDQINGAAGTMRRLSAWSAGQDVPPITVVTCGPQAEQCPGLVRLPAAAELPIPAYGDPNWRLGVPSALDLLDIVETMEANVIHAATPGPMGVAGLVVARTLSLPFVASYHTEFADYAMQLTGDRLAADITRRAVGCFYSQAECVFIPTRSTGLGLMDQGVEPSRLFIFGRGIDTQTFHPEHASWSMRHRLGGRSATVVLYVGRLSREKGLDVLAHAFRRAASAQPKLELVLVGEGPYRTELAELLRGTRHRFMGALTGSQLSSAYASADIFCLPSRIETFGQVVVEAAASGLPVIVTDQGGAHESVVPNETGLIVAADQPDALARAIGVLAADPAYRRQLGASGRLAATQRSGWAELFAQLVASYGDVLTPAVRGPARDTPPGAPAVTAPAEPR